MHTPKIGQVYEDTASPAGVYWHVDKVFRKSVVFSVTGRKDGCRMHIDTFKELVRDEAIILKETI